MIPLFLTTDGWPLVKISQKLAEQLPVNKGFNKMSGSKKLATPNNT
jgi:hypothetical protein